jgi:hypothetical protein
VLTFALLFPAVLLCARALYARRLPRSRTERWGWRIAHVGYALGSVGLVAASFALIPGDSESAVLNLVFLALMLPGMLVSVVGSTVLGVALLRDGYRPRVTSWRFRFRRWRSCQACLAITVSGCSRSWSRGVRPVCSSVARAIVPVGHQRAPTAFEVGP